MEPEAKYTLVGTAVLVLAALIVGAVLWLRSTGDERDDRFYKIYFVNQSLEGMQIRSDVKMRGIRVGAVTGFRISARRPGAVEVVIRVDADAPVRHSTRAVVERHLLTGIASIRLLNLDETSPPLTETPAGEAYPLIAEGASQLEQFSQSVTQLAQHADETMQRINTTLSAENQRVLTEVLKNLQRLSFHAEQSLAGVERTLEAVGGAAEEVRAAGRSVGEDAHQVALRYDKLGEESTVAVREAAASIRQMSADVARVSQRRDALLATGDVELRVTAQELRATADSLGAVARRLGDPRSILYGPPEGSLGPGEGRR